MIAWKRSRSSVRCCAALLRARSAAEEFFRSGRSPRLLAGALAEAMGDEASIEDVDRSADDDRPARPSEAETVTPPRTSGAAPEVTDSVAPETPKEGSRSDDFRTPRRNRKWPSLEDFAQQGSADEQWQGYQPAAQRSAPHASSTGTRFSAGTK